MVASGDFTNRLRKEENQKQRTKVKLYLSECRVPRRGRRDKKPFLSEQCKKNRGKQWNGKDKSLEAN